MRAHDPSTPVRVPINCGSRVVQAGREAQGRKAHLRPRRLPPGPSEAVQRQSRREHAPSHRHSRRRKAQRGRLRETDPFRGGRQHRGASPTRIPEEVAGLPATPSAPNGRMQGADAAQRRHRRPVKASDPLGQVADLGSFEHDASTEAAGRVAAAPRDRGRVSPRSGRSRLGASRACRGDRSPRAGARGHLADGAGAGASDGSPPWQPARLVRRKALGLRIRHLRDVDIPCCAFQTMLTAARDGIVRGARRACGLRRVRAVRPVPIDRTPLQVGVSSTAREECRST